MDFCTKLDAIKFIVDMKFESEDGISITVESNAGDANDVPEDKTILTEPEEDSATVEIGSSKFEGVFSKDIKNHVIFVESCETVPNSCGTGVIIFEGKKLILNMCEMDGITTVYLPATINGVSNHNTPFTVKKSSSTETRKFLLAK